ncbi:hypothetical protein ACIQ6R_00470 [Streptomyces sp. NPDC096048]|uniref:hypothetical protein n=1 Tax=Streptomyces sp. NPDC096048 TaxID=3366072 RepID=UPI003814D19F
MLNDAKEELRAGYAAIIANDPDSAAVAFCDTDSGRSQSKKWIKSYTDKNVTVIGKLPASDPKVTVLDGGTTASLGYSHRRRAPAEAASNTVPQGGESVAHPCGVTRLRPPLGEG